MRLTLTNRLIDLTLNNLYIINLICHKVLRHSIDNISVTNK